MTRHKLPAALGLALAWVAVGLASSVAAAHGSLGAADGSVAVFDTGRPSAVPLAGRAVAGRDGWTRLAQDQTSHEFGGDAVLSNGRLSVVFRLRGPGAELYSHGGEGPTLRAVLAPTIGAARARSASIAVAENAATQAAVDVAFRSPDGARAVLRFELQIGQIFVKTQPRAGFESLHVEAPCRFAIMPDFFADDLAVDAAELPLGMAELPSENFLLHLVGRGEAIVASVWDQREEDVEVAVADSPEGKTIRASRIPYGADGGIYVAVLEGPAIWHARDVTPSDADRVIALDWKAPFAAQWRVDWRQDDGLTDSWEMLLEQPDGTYVKPDWFGQSADYGTDDWMQGGRKRWTTVLGYFEYPCWIDRRGRGFFQPLKQPGNFAGPALIYPLDRVVATPLAQFTVVDLMRATLGVGPCRYVLDVEGQQKQSAGIPTCDARTILNAIYGKRQQKQRRAEVERTLDDVLAFMRHIRARIEDYRRFGRETITYLEAEKRSRPELAGFLDEMESVARRIDAAVGARRDGIHTPEHATRLVDEFRATLLGDEGPDALSRCKRLTEGFVEIGGNQDEVVGECRVAVRILRQKAALAMAADPRTAEVAKELRRRTQVMLRNPTSYEAPRH